MRRSQRLFMVFLLAIGPVAWSMGGCSKKEEPAPTPAVEEPEEKPKKKKKKTEDEDTTDVGAPLGDEDVGAPKAAGGTGVKAAPKSDSGASDADKAKLIACCTALRNAAQAAGIANSAASAAIPGMPAPPPKEELDKAVKECDKQVANWNGDLNASLKNVKGASPVKLPSACLL